MAPLLATADTVVQLSEKQSLATFYISIDVHGEQEDYLLDTGAGYMTITDATLARLQGQDQSDLVGHRNARCRRSAWHEVLLFADADMFARGAGESTAHGVTR